MSKRWMGWTLLVVGGGALGCAGTREVPDELTEARSDVDAVNRSDARTYAPSESADAQRMLRSAECSLLTRQGLDKVKLRASEASAQAARACAVAKQNRTLAEATAAADEAARAEALDAAASAADEAARAESQAELDRLAAQTQAERELLAAEAEEKSARLSEAEAEIQRLQDELGFQQTEEGQVLTMSGSMLFGFDSADLLEAAEPRLEQVAEVLLTVEQPLVLEGHTDDVGNADYNRELSARRAGSVKDFLVDAGVPAERISIQAMGEDDPIAANDSVEGRALNRRVELVLPDVSGDADDAAIGGSGVDTDPADEAEDAEPAPPHRPGDPTTILPEPDLPVDSGSIPETMDDGTGGSGLPEPETPLEGDPYPTDYEERMHSAPDGLDDDDLQVVPQDAESRDVTQPE